MAIINSFDAVTGSFPQTIDLVWTLSEDLGATEEVRVRRSESIYPLPTEGIEVFSTSSSLDLTFKDTELDPDTFYYYAAYIFDTATSTFSEQTPEGRERALSYRLWGEGERLFAQFPADIQDNDAFFGNHLKKLFQVVGNMGDYFRSRVCVAGYWRRPDIQDERLLDFYSLMFGFPPERSFDLRVLRNLALGLVKVFKKKGTCQGMVDFIKIFTTWDSRCDDDVDLVFRTWDPNTKRNLAYLTGTNPKVAFDTNANFSNNIWTNGKFVDSEDDPFYTVLGNDATSITFATKTPPFDRLDGTAGEGLDALTLEDLTQTWVTDQWRGHRVYVDSFSTVDFFIVVSNTTTTLTLNPFFSNFGTPTVFQQVGIDDVLPAPSVYRIEPEYYVQQGRHSLLYDNTVPPGFRGLTKDPAHFLVGGNRSLLTLGQFSDNAIVLIIEGVADFVGRSTDVVTTILTDTNASFGPVDGLVGKRLNPNILQAQDFIIIANTTTTITVEGDLLSVSVTGTNYFILNEFDSLKSKRLREVIPEFAPYYADLFLFFEPIN